MECNKICSTCGETKTPESFGARKASKDGLNSSCRICKAARDRASHKGLPKPTHKYVHKRTAYNKGETKYTNTQMAIAIGLRRRLRSLQSISDIVQVPCDTLSFWFRVRGVALSHKQRGLFNRVLPEDQELALVSERRSGTTISVLCQRYGLSKSGVKQILSRHGVTIPMEVRQNNSHTSIVSKNPEWLSHLRAGLTPEVIAKRSELIKATWQDTDLRSRKGIDSKSWWAEFGPDSKYDWAEVDARAEEMKMVGPHKRGPIDAQTAELVCFCGTLFYPQIFAFLYGKIQSCGCRKSKGQVDLLNHIRSWGFAAKNNDRSTLKNREVDILIADKKLGIEYNGLWCHTQEWLDSKGRGGILYHADKFQRLAALGIQLITIFEDEWLEHPDLVLSMIRAKLGAVTQSIFARKCKVTWDKDRIHDFIQQNHIQGACHGTHLGLELDGKIVAGMIFRANGRLSQSGQELARFCGPADTRVVGGFSKLLQAFIRHQTPTEIVSLSDNRWSDGSLYVNNGFSLLRESEPSYYYVKGNKRLHKSQFRLERLKKMGWYEEGKTESQITAEHGLHRIYDCGKKTWIFKP